MRRDLLFFLEAAVLIGPLAALVVYFLIFLAAVRVPVTDPSYLLPALAVPLAAVALFELFRLTLQTAKLRRYRFGSRFWSSLCCGIASAVIVIFLLRLAAAVVLAPALVLFAHMLYLQRHIAAQQGAPAELSPPAPVR